MRSLAHLRLSNSISMLGVYHTRFTRDIGNIIGNIGGAQTTNVYQCNVRQYCQYFTSIQMPQLTVGDAVTLLFDKQNSEDLI